jgi:NAD(P)H dehydrogenase (quinone)
VEVLEVLCHPQAGSLNHAAAEIARAALTAAGHVVYFHDLYAEGFDPVLSAAELKRAYSFDPLVQACSNELESAGGILFVHPEWWGGPPALLKGWIERVFRPGLAYEVDEGEGENRTTRGLLGGRRALVLATTDRPGLAAAERDKRALEAFWGDAVLGYCGITAQRLSVLHSVRHLANAERKAWLQESARLAVDWLARPGER